MRAATILVFISLLAVCSAANCTIEAYSKSITDETAKITTETKACVDKYATGVTDCGGDAATNFAALATACKVDVPVITDPTKLPKDCKFVMTCGTGTACADALAKLSGGCGDYAGCIYKSYCSNLSGASGLTASALLAAVVAFFSIFH